MRSRRTTLGWIAVSVLIAAPAFSDNAPGNPLHAGLPFAERAGWQPSSAVRPRLSFAQHLGWQANSAALARRPFAERAGWQTSTGVDQRLPFADRPGWQTNLAIVAHDGLPMMRLRRGEQSDLVLGINRKGFLGIYTTLPDHVLLH
jgi:hypothetical protein